MAESAGNGIHRSKSKQEHQKNLKRSLWLQLPVFVFAFVSGAIRTLVHHHFPFISRSKSDGGGDIECIVQDYDDATLADLLNERFDRPVYPYSPPKSWPLAMKMIISGSRALMHNDISLNSLRMLTQIQKSPYPKHSISIQLLPSTPDDIDRVWNIDGVRPILRLENVGPADYSHTGDNLHFDAPSSLGKISKFRYCVFIDGEGHAKVIDGEWVTAKSAIAKRKVHLDSMFGQQVVDSASILAALIASSRDTLCVQKVYPAYMEYSNAFAKYRESNPDASISQLLESHTLKNERVVLYLHGGGYCVMSAKSHRPITSRISKNSGYAVQAINYRRAPEFRFPAALIDATSAYLQLIHGSSPTDSLLDYCGSGLPHPAIISGSSIAPYPIHPSNITIMGDSAGGNLVMTLLLHLRDSGYPVPGCAVMLSPWLDVGCSLPTWTNNHAYDFIPRPDSRRFEDAIGALTGWKDELIFHPLLSPVFADVSSGLCPCLLQVGQFEYLVDDAMIMYQKMSRRRDGGIFRVEVYEDMIHVWHFFDFLESSKNALQSITDFMHQTRKLSKNSGTAEAQFVTMEGERLPLDGPVRIGGKFERRGDCVRMFDS